MDGKSDKGLDTANVKLILFFTENLTFTEAETRLNACEKDLSAARRYVSEKDKVLHLVSAYLKKKYIVNWTTNEYGKPVSDGICFNLSHCNGVVALALSDKDVGVDVENIRQIERSVVEYVSDKSETDYVKDDKDFFRLWTAKESLAKCQGRGLVKDLKSIPAFPFDGEKVYLNESYYSKQTEYDEYIITIVRKSKEPFTIDITKENI